jgi:hypothetical protein
MAESLDFELGRARLRVKRAEKSLSRAKEETGRENGVAVISPCVAGFGQLNSALGRPGSARPYLSWASSK